MDDGAGTAQVVALDDARQLVADAVESQADATRDALEGVAAESETRLVEDLLPSVRSIAQDVAAQAVEDSQAEAVEVVAVTLDDAQWQFVRDSLRVQNTGAVLGLLLLAMLLGVTVARYVVEGWRR